jgi:hypothetical protein
VRYFLQFLALSFSNETTRHFSFSMSCSGCMQANSFTVVAGT